MTTRDAYVALLEKRAELFDVYKDPQSASGAPTAVPENDAAASAAHEHNQNKSDSRDQLHTLFANAGAVQSNQTEHLKKMFHDLPKDTVTRNPLIKMARAAFFDAVGQGEILKTASPIHIELAFSSFCDELEKIAALKPQTMAQLAQKNQIAAKNPKVWDISSPASAAGAGAKPSLPEGSGTSIARKGILARIGLK
jgi:hypothetical protein